MKVPKRKIPVKITCTDDTLVEGFIYVREGLRLVDDLNNQNESFKVITNVKFSDVKIMPFKLHKVVFTKKREYIIVNKKSIKWIENKG